MPHSSRPIPHIFLLVLFALMLGVPAFGQTVYRCGNEYTNRPEGRTDCTPVEGGNITIVPSSRPAPPRATAPRSRAAAAQTPSQPTEKSVIEKRREADAKAILQQELDRAERRQAELEAEYKGGQPDKIGGEARNYQKYLDRVAELEAAIERNKADIEGIRRELQRYQN